jgi:hypothetical protein
MSISDGRGLRDAGSQIEDAAARTQILIGSLTLTDDPIGVDLTKPNMPVWTAMHEDEPWVPAPVSHSLTGFLKALEIAARTAKGRNGTDELGANPFRDGEIESMISRILAADPGADEEFWRSLFETD